MASRPRRRIALVVAGVALLGAAGAIRFVAVPELTELPTSFSGTQDAVGTYSGINPGGLKGHGPALVKRTPVTVTRAADLQPAADGLAQLTISSTVKAKNLTIPRLTYRYALDRHTFLAVPPPGGMTGVTPAQGGIVSLPPHPTPDGTYRWWDQFTQRTVPLTYSGTEEVAGRKTLVFVANSKGDVPDPKVLGFPTSFSRDQAVKLAPALGSALPASLRSRLPELLKVAPSSMKVEYRAATKTTIYADADLGIPLKARLQQSVSTRLKGIAGFDATVSTVDLTTRKNAIASTAAFVGDAAFKLMLIGAVLPAVLGLLGALLLIAGLVQIQRARRDPWVWLREVQRVRRRKRRAEKLAYNAGWGAGVVTGTGMAVATKTGEMVSHVVDEVKAEIRGDDVAEVIGEELGKVDGAVPLVSAPLPRTAPAEPTGSDDVVWQGPAVLPEEPDAAPLPTRIVTG